MMKKIGRSKGYRTVSCEGEGTVNVRMRVAIAIIVYLILTRAGLSRVPRSQPPPGLPRDLTRRVHDPVVARRRLELLRELIAAPLGSAPAGRP